MTVENPRPVTQQNRDDSAAPAREYEQSGCYPAGGKPFRIWALLGWLTLLMTTIAGAAAVLNVLLLD